VLEYTADGTFIGRYNPAALGGYRGVYALSNGNILTTNGNGVHEIDRTGSLVETKISGIQARFIEYVMVTWRLADRHPSVSWRSDYLYGRLRTMEFFSHRHRLDDTLPVLAGSIFARHSLFTFWDNCYH
jgi:hypothetical protein